jgi:membrane protease subunit (stomatin/prohibitin family)
MFEPAKKPTNQRIFASMIMHDMPVPNGSSLTIRSSQCNIVAQNEVQA